MPSRSAQGSVPANRGGQAQAMCRQRPGRGRRLLSNHLQDDLHMLRTAFLKNPREMVSVVKRSRPSRSAYCPPGVERGRVIVDGEVDRRLARAPDHGAADHCRGRVGARNVLDHRLECRARRQRDPLADHRGARHRVGRRGGDEREAYLSTPLFEGIPEGMTEEEQAISLSTPSAQMAAE